MITKFVSEPSEEINGRYNVMKFNEVDNEYQPFEKGLSEFAARSRAKFLNDEYILEEIRERFSRNPKNKHLFVENNNIKHFYVLLNYKMEWNDVLLIEFRENEVVNVLHGNNHEEREIIRDQFTCKWLNISTSGYTEYLLEEIFPLSAPDIDSKIKKIVDGVNRK
jgi:hypothetical protein